MKLLEPESEEVQDKKRYDNVVKGLSFDKPYYFYNNHELTNDNKLVRFVGNVPPFIDNYYDPFGKDNKLALNVCAIVGKNGSGKSSIIELVIRLINNFACSIIGDTIIFNSAHPLHFVPDIFAELYYEMDGNYYKIKQYGNSISLYEAEKESHIYTNTHNGGQWLDNIITPIFKESHLNKLFYTIVVNYSHYSYNLYDFQSEWSSIDLMKSKLNIDEEEITRRRKKGEPEILDVERCWLTGIFHKNDGYQTPIVLNPFRYDGNIDIKREGELEKDRLLSLILSLDDNNQNILTEVIEDKVVASLDISTDTNHITTNEEYKTQKLEDFYTQIDNRVNFTELYNEIVLQWSKLYAIDFKINLHNDHLNELHECAINYLVYKTLRITWQYNEYSFFYSDLINNKRQLDLLICDLVKRIDEDKSHITLKIRQTISFLLCHHISCGEDILINEISKVVTKALKEDLLKNIRPFQEQSKKSLHLLASDGGAAGNFRPVLIDMLPPPFFKVDINMKNNDTGVKTYKFSTLSSGEKQLIYTIGSILYHLRNVDSVRERGETDDTYYQHINIILEEIELYYHPEMQRKLISYLVNNINRLHLNTLSIQIMLVTHSPFVLSDIPGNNVLYLTEGKPSEDKMPESFGANIFELLKDNFYLKDGPIGVHSYSVLKKMFELLNEKEIDRNDYETIRQMTEYVGEPFLKEELEKLLQLKNR